MPQLVELKCIPCQGGEPTLTDLEIARYQPEVPEWRVVVGEDGIKRLERSFKFKDFGQALAFTNKIGAVAEQEGHHPLVCTTWGRVTVTWWTHKIKGLHRNDFIMAAKTDRLYAPA